MLVGQRGLACPCAAPPACRGCTAAPGRRRPTSRTAEVSPAAATRPRTNAIIDVLLSWLSAGRQRGLEPACGAPAPDVADRQGQRVGGVGRSRRLGQPQQPGDHRAHLRLVGAAAAGDRGLDLAGRVQRDREPAAGGDQQRDAAGLGRAHHGADVVLAEDPLDGDGVGLVASSHDSSPASIWHSRSSIGCRPRCVRRRRRPASAAGRPSPRPRRLRSGSGRGRSRARACQAPRTGAARNRPNTCSHHASRRAAHRARAGATRRSVGSRTRPGLRRRAPP